MFGQGQTLFGNLNQQNNQQPPATGGLFGNQPSTGGIFGNTAVNPSQPQSQGWGQQNSKFKFFIFSGLFGNNPPNTNINGGGSSLLGTTNQNLGGGNLFGKPNNSGSIFGNNPQQPAPIQNLFGPQGASTTSPSLFGSNTLAMGQNQNQAGSSIFGNNQNQAPLQNTTSALFGNQQSSIFGNNPVNVNTTNSFMGNTANNQAPNSIFGSKKYLFYFLGNPAPTSSNLFNNQTQQQQQNTGIFGNNLMNNNPNPTGGLFANASLNQNTNKMFGNIQNTNQPQPGGLFNNAFQNNASSSNTLFANQGNQQQPNNLFGVNNQQNANAGIFNKPVQQNFVNLNITGSYSVKYTVTTVDEPSFNQQASGNSKSFPIKLISITAMNEYANKSFEEIRIEDYRAKLNNLIPNNAPGVFGGNFNSNQTFMNNNLNNIQQQNQQNTQNANPVFASVNNTNNTLFGNNSLFNKPQQTGIGANVGTGLFNNANQTNQIGSALSTGQGMGLFNPQSNTNQNTFNQQNNANINTFNQQNKPSASGLFANTTGFNQNNTQQTSVFGNNQNSLNSNQQQPQIGGGLFNQGIGLGQNNTNTLNLGNANTQQPSTSLFGNAGNQLGNSNNAGGLFSTNNQTGLFAQPNTQNNQIGGLNQSSLFNNQQQNSTSGLFSQNQNKPQTSLFANPTNTSTSLFNTVPNTNQQQNSGLFSNNNATTGGLFQNNQQSTGLFSNNLQTGNATKSSSNLFGNPTGNQGGTSLFSNSTSLFGNTNANQTNLGGNQGSLFGENATQKTGLFSNNLVNTVDGNNSNIMNNNIGGNIQPNKTNPFLDLVNLGKKSIDEMLEQIQKEYLEEQFNNFKKLNKSSNIYDEDNKKYYPEIIPFELQHKYSDYGYTRNGDINKEYYKEKDNYYDSFLKSKRGQNYGKRFDLFEYNPTESTIKAPSSNNNIFKQIQMKKESELMKKMNITSMDIKENYRNNDKSLRNDGYNNYQSRFGDRNETIYKSKDIRKSHSNDNSNFNSLQNLNKLENEVDNLNLDSRKNELNELENIYEVNIVLQDPIKFTTTIKILKTKPVNVLKKAIANELFDKNPILFRKTKENSFILMKNYYIIKDDVTIESANIKNGDNLYILFHERFEKIKFKEENNKINRKDSSNSIVGESKKKKLTSKSKEQKNPKIEFAPIEKLPTITKKGYNTIPNYKEICRMTLKELQTVKDFTIFNEHGKIMFEGETDLSDLNIDQIVNISEREITLYRNGKSNITPELGKGLNKPAEVWMYNLKPENIDEDYNANEDFPKFLASLQELCNNMGAEFKTYDNEKGILHFRVEHF